MFCELLIKISSFSKLLSVKCPQKGAVRVRRYYCHSRVSGEGGSGAGGQISGLREVIIPACHPHNQLLLAAHNFRYGFRVVHFLSAASRISKFLPRPPPSQQRRGHTCRGIVSSLFPDWTSGSPLDRYQL